MKTLLTNTKMAPELAARVEASVSGRGRTSADAASAARSTALIRLLVIVAVVAVSAALVYGRRAERDQIDRDRAALLGSLQADRAQLTDEDQQAVPRVESTLLRIAGPYEGDLVSPEMKAPGALDAVLSGPTIYVHGAIDAFQRTSRIAPAAASSVKDAFLLCLADTPASREEPVLLPKVRNAYAGLGVEKRTAGVHRLQDAEAGVHLLSAAFEERIKLARDSRELNVLRAELDPDLLGRAKAAMKSKTLLAVMDEPGTGTGPSELDGERAHPVRVYILDLATNKVLLRKRSDVDPSEWSVKARPDFASGLDQCALAHDIRAGL